MYRFVKIKDTRLQQKNIWPWVLLCDDSFTLIKHTEKYMATSIEDGIKDIFSNDRNDISSNWGKSIQQYLDIKGGSPVDISITLENKVFQGKQRCLELNHTLLLRSNGSYSVLTDDLEIINTIEKEKMVYPSYSESDIKISQWPGGNHYYAKIGEMEVSDNSGNIKWNTSKQAYEIALSYL